MDAPWDAPEPNFETLAGEYEGKRFNSPNDVAPRSNGDLYFTDPPYGLQGGLESKELDFQGVYRLATNGSLTLLTDELSRPERHRLFTRPVHPLRGQLGWGKSAGRHGVRLRAGRQPE